MVPDALIINANVHGADAHRPPADATAICGERIAHVGTSDGVRRMARRPARVVDARGRLVSRDLFTVPPREILDRRAVPAMAGGRIVHEAH